MSAHDLDELDATLERFRGARPGEVRDPGEVAAISARMRYARLPWWRRRITTPPRQDVSPSMDGTALSPPRVAAWSATAATSITAAILALAAVLIGPVAVLVAAVAILTLATWAAAAATRPFDEVPLRAYPRVFEPADDDEGGD